MDTAENASTTWETPLRPSSDRAVFDALYPALRRFAAVLADYDMDPDDLVQDALTATLRRHELSELEHPAAYLKRAIVNNASNSRRSAGRLRALLPRLHGESVAVDHYPSDLALLDVLSALDRAVIYMADVEGYPHELIAEELGMTAAAVRKRASRGRAQLRQLLASSKPARLRSHDASDPGATR